MLWLGRGSNRGYNTSTCRRTDFFQGKNSLEPILKTENLWKLYRAGKVEVPALRGVNFASASGRIGSGNGPVWMRQIVAAVHDWRDGAGSQGKVLVDGNDLTTMSDAARTKLRRHKIGFVFQRFNLLPTLTAKGNIAIAQFIHGDGFDPHRFDVVTKMLGLAGAWIIKPSEMSGGSSSGWPSPERSSMSQKFCWPMSPPES